MQISAHVLRVVAAAAVVCAGLGASALASGGGSGGEHKPVIHNTSMGNGENGGIALEVGAAHAKKVVANVGPKKSRERIELDRGGRQNGLTYWTGTLSDRDEQCARLRVTAINRAGTDERDDPVCIFGQPEPEPPGGTSPLP